MEQFQDQIHFTEAKSCYETQKSRKNKLSLQRAREVAIISIINLLSKQCQTDNSTHGEVMQIKATLLLIRIHSCAIDYSYITLNTTSFNY